MPYGIRKSGSGYKIYNKETGRTYSKKSLPKARALKQMRALYANVQESFEDGSIVSVKDPVHFITFDDLRANQQSHNNEIDYGIEAVASLMGSEPEDECDAECEFDQENAEEQKGSGKDDASAMAIKNIESICRNCESIRNNIENLKPWMAHKLSIAYAYLNDIEESLSSD